MSFTENQIPWIMMLITYDDNLHFPLFIFLGIAALGFNLWICVVKNESFLYKINIYIFQIDKYFSSSCYYTCYVIIYVRISSEQIIEWLIMTSLCS